MQLAATRGGGEKRCSGRSQLAEINTGVQPCEPKPRWLRHENNTAPTEAELANLNQRALFLNKANAACGELARRKLKQRASAPGDCGSRATLRTPNNYSLSILPRHYAASGLLNLRTTLVQAVACTTPGVKLPKAKIIKTERTPTGNTSGSSLAGKPKHPTTDRAHRRQKALPGGLTRILIYLSGELFTPSDHPFLLYL